MFGPGAMRLMLALLVFVSHVSSLNIGSPAVMLFFILSGYWVNQLYANRPGSVADFWFDRWLRIWPLMAVVATGWALVRVILGLQPVGSLLSTLALLGLAVRHDDSIGVIWSLDMEFQFYLLLPAVFTLAATGRLKLLGIISVIAFIAGSVLHAYGWQNVLTFAPSFAAGMALNATRWKPRMSLVIGGAVAFALVGVAMAAVPETYPVIFKARHFWWLVSVQTVWTLLLVPLVAWNLHQQKSSPPYDRMLGDLSFPFYLVHVPVTALVYMVMDNSLVTKVVALLACLVATLLLYVLVDRPIERWRIGRRRRLAQAVASA